MRIPHIGLPTREGLGYSPVLGLVTSRAAISSYPLLSFVLSFPVDAPGSSAMMGRSIGLVVTMWFLGGTLR